jgi:SET domain-containing protein 6
MANSFQDKVREKRKKSKENKDNSEEEDKEDEKEEVTMMPMADMLNHKTGFNNVYPLHRHTVYIFIVLTHYFYH